jgi:hypothetical protein
MQDVGLIKKLFVMDVSIAIFLEVAPCSSGRTPVFFIQRIILLAKSTFTH